MFKCRLADLNINFEDKSSSLQYRIGNFQHHFEKPDLTIPISREDIEFERKLDNGENASQSDEYFEEYAAFRNLGEKLPEYDAVVMHSCLINVLGQGVAFTARSGTGKTTHMLLWKQTLNEKMTIVNGDKPLVRFVDGGLYAYGSPWAGKERLFSNSRVELKHICKIERSAINTTVPMSKQEGIILLMQQIYMPIDKKMLSKTIELINRIAEKVQFWTIYCNMELDAAKVAQEAIFSDEAIFEKLTSVSLTEKKMETKIIKDNNIEYGSFVPEQDTGSFILSKLSFIPKKIIINCNDLVVSKPERNNAYYINYSIDADADIIFATGTINTVSGTKDFALSRSNVKCTTIQFSKNGVNICPLSMGGLSFVFHAEKKYTWIAIG